MLLGPIFLFHFMILFNFPAQVQLSRTLLYKYSGLKYPIQRYGKSSRHAKSGHYRVEQHLTTAGVSMMLKFCNRLRDYYSFTQVCQLISVFFFMIQGVRLFTVSSLILWSHGSNSYTDIHRQ